VVARDASARHPREQQPEAQAGRGVQRGERQREAQLQRIHEGIVGRVRAAGKRSGFGNNGSHASRSGTSSRTA
jgi:hypothetical protein